MKEFKKGRKIFRTGKEKEIKAEADRLEEECTPFVWVNLLKGKLTTFDGGARKEKNADSYDDHGSNHAKFANDRAGYEALATRAIKKARSAKATVFLINCTAGKRRSGLMLAHLLMQANIIRDPAKAAHTAKRRTGEAEFDVMGYGVVPEYKMPKRRKKSAVEEAEVSQESDSEE